MRLWRTHSASNQGRGPIVTKMWGVETPTAAAAATMAYSRRRNTLTDIWRTRDRVGDVRCYRLFLL